VDQIEDQGHRARGLSPLDARPLEYYTPRDARPVDAGTSAVATPRLRLFGPLINGGYDCCAVHGTDAGSSPALLLGRVNAARASACISAARPLRSLVRRRGALAALAEVQNELGLTE
jgi:hypothetical protein